MPMSELIPMREQVEPVREVEEITVIKVVTLRGEGTEDDPCREATEYFTPDGQKLAEHDGLEEMQDG